MNLSKNKLVAGVVGLIAVVGIINTQAIVKLSNSVGGQNQEAQVFNASNTNSKCIQVLPASENRTSFIDPIGVGYSNYHEYAVGLRIKNRCNFPVSIIHDRIGKQVGVSDVFTNNIQIVKIQKFSNLTNPFEINGGYDLWGPQPVQSGSVIITQGADISIPSSGLDAQSSFLSSQSPTWASTIAPLGERDFAVYGSINTFNSPNPELIHARVSLNKFRWFKTSSYTSDNTLSSNEVNTFTFAPDSFTSSYARFNGCAEGVIIGMDSNGNPIYCQGSGGGGGDDCAEGTIIGINPQTGEPIYCEGGNGDCPEGTIIGYNPDGTPIYCQGGGGGPVAPNPNKPCAKGTIIGYDSLGNPIYCGDQIGKGDCAVGTIIGIGKNGSPIYCGQ